MLQVQRGTGVVNTAIKTNRKICYVSFGKESWSQASLPIM